MQGCRVARGRYDVGRMTEKHTAENAERRRTRRNPFGSSPLDKITGHIIGAAIRVHSAVGPGLLESTYEACMYRELTDAGLKTDRQLALPLVYIGTLIDLAYRIDLLVEDTVLVELK